MDSSTKIHQGIGKAEKIQPKEARYLELEPDPEAEKVNLKHQIEDERKRTEEWMLDYALQQAISQLAPTQKRKVGLLVTAFETVVPPQRSNMQVKFPKMKTRNEDNLQMEDDVLEKYSTHVDKRNAEDDWSMLKNEDTQKTIVLCQKLDEVTTTSSDKVSVDGEENNMIVPSASECDENKKITEAESEDGTHRKQVNKQNHISMWHMISQHVLSDVVSKVGSDQLLEGTDDELREDEIINRELSKNEPFAIKQSSGSDDFIEAKCSTKFSSASACNGAMELEENLQEKDDKATSNEDLDRPSCSIGDSESWNYTPTENAEPNASAKNLHVARLPKGKHRSMWTLIHRHVISDEYTESDSKVTCGADEENHKFCAAESSCSLLKFSERESMTTNQDADNQGVEARKFLAIKLVREAIERILLPEVQDQSSDNQSVASEGEILVLT
ncbi:hypothetical protein K7X08_037411 [Anisodus acutangulus]|uniref:Calmodulin-binding domain-containing protein n=1 Tax=Anisodus acutangulus TaxID=402998 RepID=A0A9Q1MWE5_9SOLA|nr:hypothetical protein K7X08_037411 [Anisodus acutangulus]